MTSDKPSGRLSGHLSDQISRRTLGGLAAAGVGVPLLAACGSDDSGATASDPASSAAASSSAPTAASSSAAPESSAAAPGGDALASTSDIEVGGGKIFADQEVVVTQPAAGEFKCFTAVCSHQGCIVSDVKGGTINCDCHGSQYSIEDGSVVTGPATFALAEEPINVAGDSITLG
ncbi:Rieske (2Fe-2S) protein [Nocardioides anomalus]|uniref:Cytochrome bc1 complex Rieske iron-sulfur subunit n=1 Tax=Nocardioides anomalus TaxID=2712223 RepID=A0A6G6WD49_9ACTN|nr:Rieske (2Fe-2S) protein [Nocardioides anomalus]QIG43077.1 Rieske (2Fe-2S) protein [Nocardioides anomalus]